MADINLDKGKTMLLMADFSTSGIGQNPIAKERQTLERAREVLDAARHAGVLSATVSRTSAQAFLRCRTAIRRAPPGGTR